MSGEDLAYTIEIEKLKGSVKPFGLANNFVIQHVNFGNQKRFCNPQGRPYMDISHATFSIYLDAEQNTKWSDRHSTVQLLEYLEAKLQDENALQKVILRSLSNRSSEKDAQTKIAEWKEHEKNVYDKCQIYPVQGSRNFFTITTDEPFEYHKVNQDGSPVVRKIDSKQVSI